MQIDSYKDQFIIDTFKAVKEFDTSTPTDRVRWFKDITKTLGIHSFNRIPSNSNEYQPPLKEKSYVLEKIVNINDFSIINYNGLHRKAMIELFDNETLWSHPLAIYLIKHYPRIKKSLFEVDALIPLYIPMKRYINMLPGMLHRTNGTHVRDLLAIDCVNPFQVIQNKGVEIVYKLIETMIMNKQVIAVDNDQVLLNVSNAIIRETLDDELFSSDVINIEENLQDLNRICRKFQIDIVK